MLEKINISFPVKKIGVVADTHVPRRSPVIPPQLFRILHGVDLILHAGDLVEEEVITELQALAPVYAVAGNMDPLELYNSLGEKKLISVGGLMLGITHGYGPRHDIAKRVLKSFKAPDIKCIVFGHSHQPLNVLAEGKLLFNPGSPTDPRGGKRPSCGILYVEGDRFKGKIFTWNI